MKKFYTVFFLVISLLTSLFCASLKTESGIILLDPHKTIIACDLDDVVISGRNLRWLMLPTNWSFALTVNKVSKRFKLHDPLLIIKKIKELYPKYSQKCDEFKKIIGTAQPKKKTIKILKKAAQQGYNFVAASNMAKGTYSLLLQNRTLPTELFSQDIYFVKTKKCNKKPDGNYHAKPDLEYFINLKKYIHKKYPSCSYEYRVFIDDKKKNVKAARKAGFIAIHYKNARKLQYDLKKCGVVL